MATIRERVSALGMRGALQALLAYERIRTGVRWNPLAASYQQNPYPTYRRLRERDPVHRSAMLRGWVVSRYEDIDRILGDHRTFASDYRAGLDPDEAAHRETPATMIDVDPPDHTRLRSLANHAFTPRAVEALRPEIEAIADEAFEGFAEAGGCEFISEFAFPLPVTVIAELLGVPIDDRERFRAWSNALARRVDLSITAEERRAADRADAELAAYLEGVIEQLRAEPDETLLSALVSAEIEGDQLSHRELIATVQLLLVAGHETTVNLLGNGLNALLDHPEELARMRREPELIGNAVEELLRYDAPIQIDRRIATRPVDVGGVQVAPRTSLILLLSSANRDPAAFEDPDRLDLGRPNVRHLSFARGIHYCLGAPLARLEAQVVFPRLLDRFATIERSEEPRFAPHITLRGLESLRLRLR